MRKTSRKLFGALAVLSVLSVARAAEDNPYAKAKVGDWVEYTATAKMQNQDMATNIRKEVIKKTDTEVTLEVTNQVTNITGLPENAAKMVKQPRKQTVVIKLDQPYTPGKPQGLGEDVVIKELGSGSETVNVGGKSYETKWMECEWSSSKNEMLKGKVKSWLSKEVPLDGLVKATTETPQGTSTLELKDCGSGKP